MPDKFANVAEPMRVKKARKAAAELDREAKRVKPETPSVRSSKSNGMSPTIKGVMKFAKLPPDFSYEKYITPHARELFAEVKNFQDFSVASKVFWISYSAWIRAVDDETKLKLLKVLALENRETWETKIQYREEWCQSMDSISRYFEGKVTSLAEAFLGSPAGKAFQADANKARGSAHRTLPDLTVESLREYNSADGIAWSTQTIFNFFSLLDDIADTHILQEDEIVEDKFDDSPDKPVEWFKGDMEAIRSNSPDSWFKRLASVAFYLVRQWIFVLGGYSQPGGQKVEPTSATCRRILQQVPTNPVVLDDNNTYPDFPMKHQSLAQWKEDLGSKDEDEVSVHEASHTAFLDRVTQDFETLTQGSNGMRRDVLKDIVTANKVTPETTAEVSDALTRVGWGGLSSSHPLDPAQIPVSPFYPPALSPTEYALVYGNSKTRMEILLTLARQEMKDWEILLGTCENQRIYWEETIKVMEEQQAELLRAREKGREILENLRDTGRRYDTMNSEIERLGGNSVTKSYITRLRQ